MLKIKYPLNKPICLSQNSHFLNRIFTSLNNCFCLNFNFFSVSITDQNLIFWMNQNIQFYQNLIFWMNQNIQFLSKHDFSNSLTHCPTVQKKFLGFGSVWFCLSVFLSFCLSVFLSSVSLAQSKPSVGQKHWLIRSYVRMYVHIGWRLKPNWLQIVIALMLD